MVKRYNILKSRKRKTAVKTIFFSQNQAMLRMVVNTELHLKIGQKLKKCLEKPIEPGHQKIMYDESFLIFSKESKLKEFRKQNTKSPN